MGYCSIEELYEKISKEEVIELLDDESINVIPEDRLIAIINEVSALIDSYVRNQVKVPLTNSDDLQIAKGICKDITIYKIYQKRPGTVDENIKNDL